MADKDEALAPYRFHIALENSVARDYWTEKLADPFLRGCFPIYSGCPNLEDYFSTGSYLSIDLNNPSKAIAAIKSVLQSELDRSSLKERQEAKRRVLYDYNIFAELEKLYPQLARRTMPEADLPEVLPVRLYSDHEAKNFKFSRRIRRWVRGWFGASNH